MSASIRPTDEETALLCQQVLLTYPTSTLTDDFHAAYERLPVIKQMFKALKDNMFHPRFTLQNDLIVTRETPPRVFVPNDIPLRTTLFKEAHDSPLAGHPGFPQDVYIHPTTFLWTTPSFRCS